MKYRVITRSPEQRDNDFFSYLGKNIGAIATFYFVASLLYGLMRLSIYYQLMFSIPIFQYVDLYDILFLAPASAFAQYLLSLLYLFMIALEPTKWKTRDNFLAIVIALIIQVYVTLSASHNGVSYTSQLLIVSIIISVLPFMVFTLLLLIYPAFRKTKLIVYIALFPIISILFTGILESYLQSWIIKETNHFEHISIKLKNGKPIRCSKDFKYLGRTKGAIFFFVPKNSITRIIRMEEIDIIDIRPSSNFIKKKM